MYQCVAYGYDSGYDLVFDQAFSKDKDTALREVVKKTVEYGCTRKVSVNKVNLDGKVNRVMSFKFHNFDDEAFFAQHGDQFHVDRFNLDLNGLMRWLNS